MNGKKEGSGYNERLFSGGLRRKLHFARFHWLITEIQKRKCPTHSILELGCFDGKVIDFLPQKPSKYVGFDANWEGGLDIAKKKWSGAKNFFFFKASTPDEMNFKDQETFDICIAMETLEHVPPQMIDGYLKKIAQHLNGYFFVTVPNEKGIVFLLKWLVKRLLNYDAEPYSFSEIIHATLGRMDKVVRLEHKGFNYMLLIKEIGKYFEVIKVSGFPLGFLPHSLCFGIGIVAKSRPH